MMRAVINNNNKELNAVRMAFEALNRRPKSLAKLKLSICLAYKKVNGKHRDTERVSSGISTYREYDKRQSCEPLLTNKLKWRRNDRMFLPGIIICSHISMLWKDPQ